MIKIFGFGSLLSLESLQATAPEVKSLTPAYVKGFRRDFSLWDPLGFTKNNRDVGHIGFCALDVQESQNPSDIVNGVVFEVSQEAFEEIKVREQEYEIILRKCYDFSTDEVLGECYFFSANKNNGEYNHNCKAQQRYLQICLDGAKDHGEEFYRQFITTTYIGNKNLEHYV